MKFPMKLLSMLTILFLVHVIPSITAQVVPNGTTDPREKCAPCTTPPPPPPSPPPPPPKRKHPSPYCPPPPSSPSSNVYVTGPPGDLYPIERNFSGGCRNSVDRFMILVGIGLLGFLRF